MNTRTMKKLFFIGVAVVNVVAEAVAFVLFLLGVSYGADGRRTGVATIIDYVMGAADVLNGVTYSAIANIIIAVAWVLSAVFMVIKLLVMLAGMLKSFKGLDVIDDSLYKKAMVGTTPIVLSVAFIFLCNALNSVKLDWYIIVLLSGCSVAKLMAIAYRTMYLNSDDAKKCAQMPYYLTAMARVGVVILCIVYMGILLYKPFGKDLYVTFMGLVAGASDSANTHGIVATAVALINAFGGLFLLLSWSKMFDKVAKRYDESEDKGHKMGKLSFVLALFLLIVNVVGALFGDDGLAVDSVDWSGLFNAMRVFYLPMLLTSLGLVIVSRMEIDAVFDKLSNEAVEIERKPQTEQTED